MKLAPWLLALLLVGLPAPAWACMADQTVAVMNRSAQGCELVLTFPSKQLAACDDDHDGRVTLVEMRRHEAEVAREVGKGVWFEPAGELAIEPIETPGYLAANAVPGFPLSSLRVTARYDVHPRRLALHYDWFPIRTSCAICLVTDHTNNGMGFFTLDPLKPDQDLYADQGPIDWRMFFRDGFVHILTGWDHLLFLLALLLGSLGLRRQLGIITTFTVAHSVTLALAASNLVSFPSSWVEAGIALTIAYAAVENLRGRRGSPWPVVVVFGLVHGLGFADGLRQLGLQTRELVPALCGYNLGVEAGQVLVVVVLYGLVLCRVPEVGRGRVVRRAGSLGLAAVGACVFLARVVSPGL